MRMRTDRTSSGFGSRPRRPGRSSIGPSALSRPAARPARCAARRSNEPVTSARGRTATTSTDPALLAHLRDAPLSVIGRLAGSTNNALLVFAGGGNDATVAVYKPVAGERPLVDFPDRTLAKREVAAFLASEAGGWGIVPPTVLRDGPYGEGMVQEWIDVDPAMDVVGLVVDADARLRPIALFDAA